MSASKLLLRYSPTERVLRSVDAPPNGTIGIAVPDGKPTLTIDLTYEPSEGDTITVHETGIKEGSTPISPDAALAACETALEIRGIVGVVRRTASAAIAYALNSYAFAEARALVDFVEEVADRAVDEVERREAGGTS
jgi:hypothetical protein